MAKINVLVGTNNSGKYADAQYMAAAYDNLAVHKPADLGITEDPAETGNTYVENSRIKRSFYIDKLARQKITDFYVIGDDSGLEIDALGGEPGIHSRRWKDGKTPMSDQEIIDYCLERMKGVPEAKRTAALAGSIALGHVRGTLNTDIPYRLRGVILETPASNRQTVEGYPFRDLFFLPQYGLLLRDIVDLPRDKRPGGFMSHREAGLKQAFDTIIGFANQLPAAGGST